jgi:multidrug efflux system outer membrane protein
MIPRARSILGGLAVVAALFEPAALARAETLSFAEAVRRAAEGAASPRIARAQIEQRDAQVAAARASLLPSLSGTASQDQRTYNLNTFGVPFGGGFVGPRIGPFPVFDARVHAVQTIADVSAWRRVRTARADVTTSRADAATAVEHASEEAALRYVDVQRALATVDARQSDLAIATELDSLAAVQLRAGSAANIDVLRAATQLTVARTELSLARNALERARIELAGALGAAPETRFEIADSLGAPVTSEVPEEREAAVRLAAERRTELGAERARIERARTERGAITAERIPRLDAAADYGASGMHPDDAIGTGQVALQLTWPFFDGTRRGARIHEQDAIIRAAEIRAGDLSRQVAAEVEGTLLDLATGREQESIARERVGLAREQLAEARVRFRNGVAGNIEVIDAQSAVVRARDAEIAARATIAVARIRLARAAGVAESLRTT